MTAAQLYQETARTATVAAGAVVGAAARFGLQTALPAALWPLLAVNLAACLAMGRARPGLFWGKGVLGGFSSFSAVAVLCFHVDPPAAAAYLAATVLGGTACWFLGDALAERARRRGAAA